MNTDSFFCIGKTHNFCQDYARHSDDLIVVSDGCSSSPDTDIGARLLTLAAFKDVKVLGEVNELSCINNALHQKPSGVDKACLDATLLFSQVMKDKYVYIGIYGDGLYIVKTKSGEIFYYEISYSNGAPAYLSYLLNQERKERYFKEFGGKRTIKRFKLGEGICEVTETNAQEDFGFSTFYLKEEIEYVLLCSDGVQSFIDSDFNPVPVSEIVKKVTDIRSFNGEFIKRNTKFFLNKECPKLGWTHNDDLAVAGIYIGDK